MHNISSNNCALEKQDFDSDIFGVDYFRVIFFDKQKIIKEISNFLQKTIIEAKIEANDIELDLFLKKQDFKKICMQVQLEINNIKNIHDDKEIQIDDYLKMTNALTRSHSNNFIYNRFALNETTSEELSQKLFTKWIQNSLKDTDIKIAHIDNDFCTFKINDNEIALDLLSVLNKKKGVATRLLQKIQSYAYANNIKKIKVTTECENKIAFNLYQKYGFKVSNFISCFTLTTKGNK